MEAAQRGEFTCNSHSLISTVASYLNEQSDSWDWGKIQLGSLDVTSIVFFPATVDIQPTTFFFFSQVQLENTYNEGTSVLSDHFAYLGVVKAYLSYGIDFPAQLLSSVLNMGNQA